jgi:hypothetical protein
LEGFAFCGACGSRVLSSADGEAPPDTDPRALAQGGAPKGAATSTRALSGADLAAHHSGQVVGELVRIEAGGAEGGALVLRAGETPVGRAHGGHLFESDVYLSPLHATFLIDDGRVTVRDDHSLNGVFVRLFAPMGLEDGDLMRVGQELLRFESLGLDDRAPTGDETQVLGSPVAGYWGRLVEVVSAEEGGDAYVLREPEVVIGRAHGEILFPDDAFVSGTHCKVSHHGGQPVLTDLSSSNGTYLRIRGEAEVSHDDFILLGQQLFHLRLC